MSRIIPFALLFLLLVQCNTARKDAVVNVYTHRHYDIDKEIFAKFTEETGIQVNVVSASADELIKKMELEGSRSPADVLITVDAGRLQRAREMGLLQSVQSEYLNKNIPSKFIDTDNQWFGLTYRARIIVYSLDRVDPSEIETYEGLTDEKWKGRVLVRSSDNIYNQSLMASMIVHKGEEQALQWAQGIVGNLAREPRGNDRDQVKAVVAGQGDLALVNTYYLGLMAQSEIEEEQKVYSQIGIIFPNQKDRGTHINLSGAGVAKYSPNKENAIRFIEFMASPEIQKVFAGSNHEYPVVKNIDWSEIVNSWGEFVEDEIKLELLGQYNRDAVMIFDKAGWK
ncbi:MAG: Fe(3+) ABC transporter substrate-binding protein [Cyclobacteriaceae bacterium]|nr:Fe(3+) ABC transporter substrate-binding protein [Cyclobacteriaceae bacterium]